MKELMSINEGFSTALETTKQHYYALHVDIRVELLRVMTASDRLAYLMTLDDQVIHTAKQENKKKPPSRDSKEIYRRICNLCHPDKIGKSDPTLLRLMQEAKEALKERDDAELDKLYEQVKFYNEHPEAYESFHKEASIELQKQNDPWFEVYEHHTRGETREAFYRSRQLLGELLTVRKSELHTLKHRAKLMGIIE